MINTLIGLYARLRDVDRAFLLYQQLVESPRGSGLDPDIFTYSNLLNALAKAEHPPYDLGPEIAARAEEVFQDMLGRGIRPNQVVFHTLMDAKAVLPDACFATYRSMLAAELRPTATSFAILMSACGRAGDHGRAADVMERLMPQAGVAPTTAIWNSMLGAYARSGSVDGAYATWVRMLESGAAPDAYTERALADALSSHPALASDVVAEARQIRNNLAQQAQQGAPQHAQHQQQQRERQQGAELACNTLSQAGQGLGLGNGSSTAGGGLRTIGEALVAVPKPLTPAVPHSVSPSPAPGVAAAAAAAGARQEGGLGATASQAGSQALSRTGHARGATPPRQGELTVDWFQAGDTTPLAGSTLSNDMGQVVLGAGSSGRPRVSSREAAAAATERKGKRLPGGGVEGTDTKKLTGTVVGGYAPSPSAFSHIKHQQQQQEQQAAARSASPASQEAQRQLQQAAGLDSRQLLWLDLHGMSRAAARASLLRRLEMLVHLAKPLLAVVEAEQAQRAAEQPWHAALHDRSDRLAGPADRKTTVAGWLPKQGVAGEKIMYRQRQQQQQPWQELAQHQQQQSVPSRVPAASKSLPTLVSPTVGSQQGFSRGSVEPQPALVIVTGLGRHSREAGAGVLRAAVTDLLTQHGIPHAVDPSNAGRVRVPWPGLKTFITAQQDAMQTDHFFGVARARYTYIAAAVAGLMATAFILPRLAPWMPPT
ncbi:hypothetical protein N2152v2_005687 [Parachlorella kessleri]